MSEGYYTPGAERSSRVRELFARIARRYDRINDLQSFGLHRVWKRAVVRAAALEPGGRALDVCCGTGDITFRLERSGARAFGCDFSREMLAVAAGRGGSGSAFALGDALRLPFLSGSFQAVTIGYGLRNLSDFRAGIRELLRVLAPGGRLVILDFGKPKHPLWRALYFAYLRLVVPIFGLVFCGNWSAYSYISESLRHYPAQEGVAQLLAEAGCEPVTVQNYLGGIMSLHVASKPAVPAERHPAISPMDHHARDRRGQPE